MDFTLTSADIAEIEADAAIGFVSSPPESGESPSVEAWNKLTGGVSAEVVASGEFRANHQSTVLIRRPSGMRARRLLLVGLDASGRWPAAKVRDAAGAAWRRLRLSGVARLAVSVAAPDGADLDVGPIAEGLAAAAYDPGKYKTGDKPPRSLPDVQICVPSARQSPGVSTEQQRRLDEATAISSGRRRARELVNEPANLLPPLELAARAEAIASETGLECELLDKERLESLRMGSLLGVAQGSSHAPVMIVLRYRPGGETRPAAHLGLVGKAVTFDTGGISLKPSKDMHLMKYDMAGGAAMIGAMVAIARLRPRVPVTAVIPSVENMPGGMAQRPGDVVAARCGTTIEVLNTDAEGRLILADALTYAKDLGCTHLVNAATLTGAIVVALGDQFTGLFSNDSAWRERILECSVSAGERMWAMPCSEGFPKMLKSPIADLANIGPRWGGACTAAAFLRHFAGDTPWAHFDIAGTAWHEKKLPHAPVGPTGVGVATLARLALTLD